MPPEGYDTVTLPKGLVQRIDEHAESIGVDSRTAALRNLLATSTTPESDSEGQLSQSAIDDIATQTSNQVVRDLESVLR